MGLLGLNGVFQKTKYVRNETFCIFASPNGIGMYTIDEILSQTQGGYLKEVWRGKIACLEVESRMIGGQTEIEGASVFSFVLVKHGRLSVQYKGRRIDLVPNDIHSYAPGMPTKTLEVSEDYEGYCLIIDEDMIYKIPEMQRIVRAAFFSIAEFGQPKITLSKEQAQKMDGILSLLRQHILVPSSMQEEAVVTLCALFGIELLDIQQMMVDSHCFTTHTEIVFTNFLRLVQEHFMQQRDLRFYADRLCVTTTYLSRIVKKMSGSTVKSFISQALANEASIRLKTTALTITQIADDLGFADQASFCKFFTRMKGVSPKEFRLSEK